MQTGASACRRLPRQRESADYFNPQLLKTAVCTASANGQDFPYGVLGPVNLVSDFHKRSRFSFRATTVRGALELRAAFKIQGKEIREFRTKRPLPLCSFFPLPPRARRRARRLHWRFVQDRASTRLWSCPPSTPSLIFLSHFFDQFNTSTKITYLYWRV